MDSKIVVAVDLLARIGQDRIKVANSERQLIPPALELGLPAERVAQLTRSTVAHVEEVRKEVECGKG